VGALVFLALSALVWLPYGLWCLAQPGYLAEAAGVAFQSVTGSTEMRAMYGGLQAALGVLALGGTLHAGLRRPALLALAFLCAGLALGRITGIALDGAPSSYTLFAVGFEIVSAAAAAWLLGRTPREALG
jgi:hypothetical protein